MKPIYNIASIILIKYQFEIKYLISPKSIVLPYLKFIVRYLQIYANKYFIQV